MIGSESLCSEILARDCNLLPAVKAHCGGETTSAHGSLLGPHTPNGSTTGVSCPYQYADRNGGVASSVPVLVSLLSVAAVASNTSSYMIWAQLAPVPRRPTAQVGE